MARARKKAWRNASRRLRLERLEAKLMLAGDNFSVDDDSNWSTRFLLPAGGFDISTYTGHPRTHSIDINQDAGATTDLNAPVFAAHDGIARVYTTVGQAGYGNSVKLFSLDGRYVTVYAHLSEILIQSPAHRVYERNGQGEPIAWVLMQGDILGRVGGTGYDVDDYLPHIHLEYRDAVTDQTVSMARTTASAQDPPTLEFYKGFFRTKPLNTISESTVTLAQDSINVAMVASGERLFTNLKGFGWDEDVAYRVRNATGQVVAGPFTVHTEFENDDDISEEPVADLNNLWIAPNNGTYFLEGVEQNRAATHLLAYWRSNGSGGYYRDATGDTFFPWVTQGFAEQYTSEPHVSARPMAMVVSSAAPPASVSYAAQSLEFESFLQQLSRTSTPWHLLPSGLLVIAGAKAPISGRELSDQISVTRSGSDWVLEHGAVEGRVRVPVSVVSGIYVGAGAGNDVIDLREVDVPVVVDGGEGNDVIMGGSADDVLLGRAGLDWIEGAQGRDWILGGADADVLFGEGAAPPQSSQTAADVDFIFGESGDDWLFTRNGDWKHGGDGIDQIYGQFGSWSWNDVPTSHAGVVIISGEVRSLEVSRNGNRVTYTTPTRSISYIDSVANRVDTSDVLVFGSELSDVIDMRGSMARAWVFSRGGNDQIVGTDFADTIFAGGGASTIFAGGGADSIFAGAGVGSQIYGEAGDDSLFSGGSGDLLVGGAGRDYFVPPTPSDHVADAEPADIVGFAARRRQERLDALSSATTSAPTQRVVTTNISTRVAGITEFTLDTNVVTQGDGLVATVRTDRSGVWARMTLFADINVNGRYDASADILLAKTRGRTVDFRGHVRTSELSPGTYRIYALLEAADGTSSLSQPLTLTVLDSPNGPTELPPHLDFVLDDTRQLIAHKNGDLTVTENELAGIGQIDLYQLTVGTTGNHAFSTIGVETIRALYDIHGDRIGDPVAGGTSLIAELVAGETYIIAVAARFAEAGMYDLVITGRNQVSNGTIDTPSGNYLGTVEGSFAPGNTVDYWEINTPLTATSLDVDIVGDDGLDLWVRVADTGNNVIGFANLTGSSRNDFLRNLPVDPGQTYYITVHGLYGTTGDYSLTADFYPDDAGLPASINVSNALADYQSLTPQADGDYLLGGQSISQVGQFRYFHLAPTYNGRFILRTGGATDTLIGMYSGNGTTLLAFSDDDGPGTNGQIELDLVGGEEYWLLVRGSGNATGLFSVEVIGPDQHRQPFIVTGLSRTAERSYSLGVTSERQTYFSVVAPEGSETLDVSAWSTFLDWPMDLVVSVENAAGEIKTIDNTGTNGSETLSGYSVVPGQLYTFTVTSKDRQRGIGRIAIDFSPDGNGSGEFVINSTVLEDQNNQRVAMNSSGRSVVVWTSPNSSGDVDVYFQALDQSGSPSGNETRANNADNFVYQYSPDAAVASDGTFWISWVVDSVVRIRRFSVQGTALTGEINTGIGAFQARIAVTPNGTLLVVGTNGNQVVGRTYGTNGSPTAPLRILDDPAGSKDVIDVAVAATGNTGFVITWTRESTKYDIIAQRLDITANKVGSEVLVYNSSSSQFNSDVSATADGRFAVAFRQNDTDGTQSNVYFALFSSSSTPVAPVTRASTIDAGIQQHPCVMLKEDGSALMAWTTTGADGSGTSVAYRYFSMIGLPFSAVESQLNEYTADDQQRPAIAGNGGDIFFPVWESYWQDGNGTAIVGHRFTLPTPAPAPGILLSESSGETDDDRLEYGKHEIGTVAPVQSLTVTNIGSALLTGTAVSTSSRFEVVGDSSFALLPGESIELHVRMLTDLRGKYSASLVINHNASESAAVISLEGTVAPEADSSEPNNTDEQATDLGTVSQLTLNGLTMHDGDTDDWFQFVVDRYSTITVDLTTAYAEGDLDLIAFDRNLGVLATASTRNDQEHLTFTLDRDETAYLRVLASGDAINVYSMMVTATETNRRPVIFDQGIVVTENQGEVANIGQVTANDLDTGQVLTYEIIGGTGENQFTIDASTGELYLAPGVTLDFEVTPAFTLDVQVTDNGSPQLSNSATVNIVVQDIAEVTMVQLGDGTDQRSSIETFSVTFDNLVEFTDDNLVAAFQLTHRNTGAAVDLVVDAIDETGIGTVVSFSFTGDLTRGAYGALVDGNYLLEVNGDRIFVNGSEYAGTSFVIGDNQSGDDRWYTLFGDTDGNRRIDFADFLRLRQTYGKRVDEAGYNRVLDYDGNSLVSFSDFLQFRSRYGTQLD